MGSAGATRRRLLYVDVKWPTPQADASSQRTIQLIDALVGEGFAVDLAAMFESPVPVADDPLGDAGSEQSAAHIPPLGGGRMVNTRGEEEMAAYVRARGSEYDAVVLAWTRVASGLMPVLYELEPRPLICFDTNDVNHVREYRHARVSGNANILRRALAMKQAELAAAARSDLVIAISEADAAVFRAGAPTARVEVITLAGPEPRDDAPGPAHRQGAFYVGNFEAWPNIDAMEHLIGDILPAIRDERPEFGLSIAGSGRPGLLDALAGPGVEILGYVPDLRASFDAARMFLVPLRAGSGIKGKVLNAMANGLPVVATPVAVEGMELRHGVDCLIADSAAGLARAALSLAGDDELWSRLQREALRTVGARFGMAAVREQAARAFRPLLSGARLASP